MKLPKLIVFDMDGVLIDVSRSYREAVRKTARLFLQGAKGGEKLPDPLFPLDDLDRLKQTGGLDGGGCAGRSRTESLAGFWRHSP